MVEHFEYKFSIFGLELSLDQLIPPEQHSSVDDRRPLIKKLACTLGVARDPVLVAVMEGERSGIASQIALQMSIDSILGTALNHDVPLVGTEDDRNISLSSSVVRECFKEANQQVYQYAHRMAASGRIAATGFVSVYDGERFSIARVGNYESLLWRQGTVVSLHEKTGEDRSEHSMGMLQRFVGANAQILVDLASFSVREGDTIVLTSLPPATELSSLASEVFSKKASLEQLTHLFAVEAGRLHLVQASGGRYSLSRNVFVAAFRVGNPSIHLTDVVDS